MWTEDHHQAGLDNLDRLWAEAELRRQMHRPHAAGLVLLGVVRRLEVWLSERLTDEPAPPVSKPNRA